MVEVIFKADTIADLKLQIQEYSLCHLGLNFKAMADGMVPKPKIAQPGKSESTVLNDGTVRLHNPSYPSKMKNAADLEEPKKRGRPLGWRKEKSDHVEEKVEAPSVPLNPKQKAGKAIQDLCTKFPPLLGQTFQESKGYTLAIGVLEKLGGKHLNDIAEEHYVELIANCEALINE